MVFWDKTLFYIIGKLEFYGALCAPCGEATFLYLMRQKVDLGCLIDVIKFNTEEYMEELVKRAIKRG